MSTNHLCLVKVASARCKNLIKRKNYLLRKYNATRRKNITFKKSFCDNLKVADDVYLTRTKIAVRKVRSDNKGRITSDTTRYFPKTKANLSCAGQMLGRIRYGR